MVHRSVFYFRKSQSFLTQLVSCGVERFIEVGPGRVLSGLLRRTDKTKKFSNIEDKKSAESLLAAPAAG
jgi:malonyl CoA-acyl carrier protein transacylase